MVQLAQKSSDDESCNPMPIFCSLMMTPDLLGEITTILSRARICRVRVKAGVEAEIETAFEGRCL